MNALQSIVSSLLVPPSRAAVRYGPANCAVWKAFERLTWQPHPFVTRTRCGFRFAGDSRDLVSRYIYYFGIWEPAITRWVQSLPLEGRTVIDVGGHFGWYTLLGARCAGSQGRVVTVEASPFHFQALRRNVSLNGFDNVRLIHSAAWNCETELDLFQATETNTGMSTVVAEFKTVFSAKTGVGYKAPVKVHAAPLTTLLRPEEVASAALLKIDVEGAEPQVVEGLLPLLEQFPRDLRLSLEYTPEAKAGLTDLLDTFRKRGFRVYMIRNDYSPEFYFSAREQDAAKPVEVLGPITKHADLVLSRETL